VTLLAVKASARPSRVARRPAGSLGQLGLNDLAILEIVTGYDNGGAIHVEDPGCFRAGIFALVEVRFATTTLFERLFASVLPAITPSRFFTAR
jgi:hypothetical protein